jgi:hypothetical protein
MDVLKNKGRGVTYQKKYGERSKYPSPYLIVGWKGEEKRRYYIN